MGQRFQNAAVETGVGYPIIGANSITFYEGDAIYISGGFLTTESTSGKILGFALDNITMSASNQTVAKVCPQYIPAMPWGPLLVYPGNQAAVQTDIGKYCTFSSATAGAQTLNISGDSSTQGDFIIIGFDPRGDGTTTDVVVLVSEPQVLAATNP